MVDLTLKQEKAISICIYVARYWCDVVTWIMMIIEINSTLSCTSPFSILLMYIKMYLPSSLRYICTTSRDSDSEFVYSRFPEIKIYHLCGCARDPARESVKTHRPLRSLVIFIPVPRPREIYHSPDLPAAGGATRATRVIGHGRASSFDFKKKGDGVWQWLVSTRPFLRSEHILGPFAPGGYHPACPDVRDRSDCGLQWFYSYFSILFYFLPTWTWNIWRYW